MTSRERAELRKHANSIDTIFQIGKDGIDSNLIAGIRSAIEARELIKCRVQDSCELSAREAAEIIADKLAAEPVQVIGSRFVLYKRNTKVDKYGI
ncbi:MAG: YhbY family RNA-binding protein [Oscillospiraceae bacterium]